MSFSTDVTPVPVAILTQIFSLKAEGYSVTPINRPISSVTSHHVTLRTGGQANVNKLLIPLRVTIEESNKAKYFEVLAPWLTFVPFMGAQIVLTLFDCQR